MRLSLADGGVLTGWPIDMQAALIAKGASFDSPHQGQRGAMLLFNGKLYASYGGNAGDCQPYHGTVAQIAPASQTVEAYWQTRGARGGIWAQGGIAGDGEDLFVTTGNTSGTTDWADGEAIIRLRPGLAASTSTRDFFTPSNWQALDGTDKDLGGTEALPFDIKTSGGAQARRIIAFRQGRQRLSRRPHNPRRHRRGARGGARVGRRDPHRARDLSHRRRGNDRVREHRQHPVPAHQHHDDQRRGERGVAITFAWCASMLGRGAPIITTTDGAANPIVWAVGAEGDDLLHGFNALNGQSVFTDTRARDERAAPFRHDPRDAAALLRRRGQHGLCVCVRAVELGLNWRHFSPIRHGPDKPGHDECIWRKKRTLHSESHG